MRIAAGKQASESDLVVKSPTGKTIQPLLSRLINSFTDRISLHTGLFITVVQVTEFHREFLVLIKVQKVLLMNQQVQIYLDFF